MERIHTLRGLRAMLGYDGREAGGAAGDAVSLFDSHDLAEITAPEDPGERLIVCRDPLLAEERALDGFHVLRAKVSAEHLTAEDAVRAYENLSRVERAFRCFKGVDLMVRPIHHRLEHQVRAHVFLCTLAYYVEWHMRERLAPLLFQDDDRSGTESGRSSVVRPAT